MQNRIFFFNYSWLVLILLSFVVTATAAEKSSTGNSKNKYRYVSDVLVITMRSGQSNEHRIIRTLESGEKLRVLQSGKDYTRVKTDKGETGWVLTRYLSEEQVARVLLPPIKTRLEKLEKENTELSASLKEITRERDSLKVAAASLERLEQKHKKLLEESVRWKDEASKSGNLTEASKDLARKNATLESQIDLMMRELRSLREGNNRLWFLSGAGVILIGIVIGVMIARSRKEKKSSWGASTDSLMLR